MNNKLKLISKPHYDVFTYQLFQDLLDTLTCDYYAYYIWSNPAHELQEFIEDTDFGTNKNIVIGIKDGLDMWVDFNYWHDTAGLVMQLLDEMALTHPDTNFIIVTSVENFDLEYHSAKNLQFFSWGGDWLNQQEIYKNLEPVLDKNFSSGLSFIALNRQPRMHRIILLSYLFGRGIAKFGQVSFLSNQDINVLDAVRDKRPSFLDISNWEFDEYRHAKIKEFILTGFDEFFANTDKQELIRDSVEIYNNPQVCDNVTNFECALRNKYKNSFIEIVTESAFTAPGFFITEKTAHCFYGCNFPIVLGGPGIVEHLRKIGFDMFDDIVDHTYDTISNPFDRIIMAIDLNSSLLANVELTKQLWKTNKERFAKNVDIINQIDNYYKIRAINQWQALSWK